MRIIRSTKPAKVLQKTPNRSDFRLLQRYHNNSLLSLSLYLLFPNDLSGLVTELSIEDTLSYRAADPSSECLLHNKESLEYQTLWNSSTVELLYNQQIKVILNTIYNTMANGTVKWFNATKGFGFIEPEEGGKDVFVHISAVERAGLRGLNEGDKIVFELVAGRNGKESAENLSVQG